MILKVRDNEYCYKGRPRLKTAHQLLMVSLDLEKNLDQVNFFIFFILSISFDISKLCFYLINKIGE